MKRENLTQDLSRFGQTELDEAIAILVALRYDNITDRAHNALGRDVQLWFNTMSGFVFLCDNDYNTAVMHDDKLDLFLSCPVCGCEGFLEDVADPDHHNTDSLNECKEYITEFERQLKED